VPLPATIFAPTTSQDKAVANMVAGKGTTPVVGNFDDEYARLNLLGGIPVLAGAALNPMADWVLKVYKTTVRPFQVSTPLVTTGAYRIARHPMYLGMVLIVIRVALLMGSLSPFLPVIIFALLMELIFVQVEERMLE